MRNRQRSLAGLLAGAAALGLPMGVSGVPARQPVLPSDALLTTPVGGLDATHSTARVVPVTGQPFTQALHVTVGADSTETNATQLTMPITAPVQKGDVLEATFCVRGAAAGHGPGHIELLFERRVSPWTKSVTDDVTTPADPRRWKRVHVAFAAAEAYAPGEAMVSLRLAFGPQTLEVGGLSVTDDGAGVTVDAVTARAAAETPIGQVHVTVRRKDVRQQWEGFGGDFCQPRYGATEPLDAVGRYTLSHLDVRQARVGIPLNVWAPAPGVYRDEGPAHAALLQMQIMARRHIPLIGSVWEGPAWLLGGRPEQSGRTLPPERYADCIEAIAQFLVTARDKYGATVDEFSFNEADYGVNFRFTPAQIAAFIKQAGPRFRALGLRTKFLVGDTGGASAFPAYVRPILADPGAAPYLGTLAFHSWDVLGTPEARLREIATIARQAKRPVWCTEAGHDSALWQSPGAFPTWENALRTALVYQKTLALTGASRMDYWTYENNYPLVAPDGETPYPVFSVLRQMQWALPAGARVVSAASDEDALSALACVGPAPGWFSLLLVNTEGPGTAMITGLPPHAPVFVIAATEKNPDAGDAGKESHPNASPGLRAHVDAAGRLTVSLPSRAVVTIVSQPGLMTSQ